MTDTVPRLTAAERAALEWLLVSQHKGGAGWHRESSAAAHVRAILEAGKTRDAHDRAMVESALRMKGSQP